jgi:hypothetical protein
MTREKKPIKFSPSAEKVSLDFWISRDLEQRLKSYCDSAGQGITPVMIQILRELVASPPSQLKELPLISSEKVHINIRVNKTLKDQVDKNWKKENRGEMRAIVTYAIDRYLKKAQ